MDGKRSQKSLPPFLRPEASTYVRDFKKRQEEFDRHIFEGISSERFGVHCQDISQEYPLETYSSVGEGRIML